MGKKNVIYGFAFCCIFLLVNVVTFAKTKSLPLKTIPKEFHSELLKEGYVEVPIKKELGYIYIEAAFDNKTPSPLILDTGNACSLTLYPIIENIDNFKKTNKSVLARGVGGYGGIECQVLTPCLQLGNFISPGELAYVATHSFPNIKFNKAELTGLLGMGFLRSYSAIIDIRNKFLYLRPPGNNQSTAMLSEDAKKILLKEGYTPVKFKQGPNDLIFIEASINNSNYNNFILDTGSAHTLVSLDFIKQLKLPFMGPSFTTVSSDGKNIKIYQVNVKKFSVGVNDWFPKKMFAIDLNFIQSNICTITFAGIVGLDWLTAKHALIDIGSDTIFIK